MILQEIWKPIKGYEGLYEVSNKGRVKSVGRIVHRKDGISYFKKGSILKPYECTGGYLFVGLLRDGERKLFSVHRLVAEAFLPNPENKTQVNHIDGNKKNNDVSNLEWVTEKENVNHAIKHGLLKNRGEDSPNSKLTKTDIENIRRMYATKQYTQYQLAEIYGVGQSTIWKIVNNERWRDDSYSHEKQKYSHAKITEEQAKEIKSKYLTGKYKLKQLADDYGLSIASVSRIINGKSWKNVG
ncbi:HNH endonuclease [Deep-sea thermophilic phage D6E]|uniref:HNH endonuclease n=1 Tax=Deep-sea thermophilic phage D6E TaxID=749413 RepID=UPI0001F390EA|nr:HNH endonuclease [Deep-sea thermophilic phage D6E]ADE87501.1 HNH endonuclease [Deep-sea thermophilic phage D6E]